MTRKPTLRELEHPEDFLKCMKFSSASLTQWVPIGRGQVHRKGGRMVGGDGPLASGKCLMLLKRRDESGEEIG